MRPRTAAVSPRGTVMVYVEGAGVYTLDQYAGTWALTYATQDYLEGVALCANDRVLYVVKTQKGEVVRVDLHTGGVAETVLCTGLKEPRGIAVSADASFALVTSALGDYRKLCLVRVNLRTGEVSKPFKNCKGIGPVFGVALSQDEKFAYVTGTDHPSIVRVDLRNSGVCEAVYTHARGFYGVALAPGGSRLVATTWGAAGCVTFINFGATGDAAAPGASPGAAVAPAITAQKAVQDRGGERKRRCSDCGCGGVSSASAPAVPGVVSAAAPAAPAMPAVPATPAPAIAAAPAAPAMPAAANAVASAPPTGQEFTSCAHELALSKRACGSAVRKHGNTSTQHVAAAERLRKAQEWANSLRTRLQKYHPQLTALLSQPTRSRESASPK